MSHSREPLRTRISGSSNTRDSMPEAFVLQVGVNGLGVTRSLARNGVRVTGLDYDRRAPGFFSRYCRPVLCPDPQKDPAGVVELLVKEGERLQEKAVLFPCYDPFVLIVSRNRKILSEYFRFMIPAEGVLEGILNKRQFYDMARRIGTPYAETFYPNNWSDLEGIKDQITYPVFIKPYYSHLLYRRFQTKGFFVKDYRELVERYRQIFPSGLDTMIQAVIQGPETNIFGVCTYIGTGGEPLGTLVYQKIRQYPKDFGMGSLTRSIHNKDLASIGVKFCKEIGYRGIGEIEFKKDEKDGKFKMIELNARPWVQNIQATRAGVNFPLIEYLDLLESPIEPIQDYKDGIRFFDSLDDIRSYIAHRESGDLSFRDWVRSWLGTECHARFAWDDMRPALVASGYGIEYTRLLMTLLKSSRKGSELC